MNKYIILLRGINVSGQKKIKMGDLKTLFESLKFSNVKTYIQSGNIVFTSSRKDKSKIKDDIEKGIRSKFGYSVSVLVKTKQEIVNIIENNPIKNLIKGEPSKFFVAFLYSNPDESLIKNLYNLKSGNDKFVLTNSEIYLRCPDGAAKTKFSNNFFENKLKVAATTRNWRTINKLVELTD